MESAQNLHIKNIIKFNGGFADSMHQQDENTKKKVLYRKSLRHHHRRELGYFCHRAEEVSTERKRGNLHGESISCCRICWG